MNSLALFGLLWLIVPGALLAEEPINGSGKNDAIIGTDSSDEIYGYDGDDELQGGAGDDVLVGGAGDDVLVGGTGFDIVFGGAGSDKFVIDIERDMPDEIRDFRPEEGDSLWLRFRHTPRDRFPKKLELSNIEIDYDGDVAIRLINEEQFKIVKIRRSDLTLTVDDLGDDIRLTFTKKLGKN
jgi:hypothetical protein